MTTSLNFDLQRVRSRLTELSAAADGRAWVEIDQVVDDLSVIIAKSVDGETSDGYHTFNELYDHRIALFLALCATCQQFGGPLAWRSKLHSDGTAFDGWFVVGLGTEPNEQITYHLPIARWDETNFIETYDKAPPFDGHTSADVLVRLRRLYT